MSGISEKQLDDWQRDIDLDPKSFTSWPLSLLAKCIAEIRRLRAENKELRDSYERVDKHATEVRLLCEKQAELCEKQADMIRKINPLYR